MGQEGVTSPSLNVHVSFAGATVNRAKVIRTDVTVVNGDIHAIGTVVSPN
jgi:uncharacterized surface protein with fasciclin (FAS1) repeats